MITKVLERFLPTLLQAPNCWIAYSGGLDSHALLHALTQLRNTHPELKLKAVHVNHGLSPNANSWQQHCENICQELEILLQTHKLDIRLNAGESLEEIAREQRYQIFQHCLANNEVILLAHHQDDQTETMLLQLFRGAGIKGLAAMAPEKTFYQGSLIRPFLELTREDLLNYAEQNHLKWIEDESNQNPRFDRNFLRNNVLPNLKQRWPNLSKTLARSAKHHAIANDLLEDMALQDHGSSLTSTLNLKILETLSPQRQINMVRHWLHHNGCRLPSTQQLEHIFSDVIHSRSDKNPFFPVGNQQIRRYRNKLYILPVIASGFNAQVYHWDLTITNTLHTAAGIITAKKTIGQGLKHSSDSITIRFRQGGERFHPTGRIGSHPLKKLFQEWDIPTWEREKIPLVYIGDELVCVLGYAITEAWLAKEGEAGWLFKLDN